MVDVRSTVILVVLSLLVGLSTPLAAQDLPEVSEFMAINGSKAPLSRGELLDEDGDSADWIEIHNGTDAVVNLGGWYLTDDLDELAKWEFPALPLNPGQYTIVFASDKDRDDPEGQLHTNFKIAGSGGFLALVLPDGRTVAHAYTYPEQFGDVSYGLSSSTAGTITEMTLLPEYTPATAWIPTDGSLGLSWTQPGFDDSQWSAGASGVGYDYGALVGLDVGAMRHVNQSVYVRIPFTVADASAIDELTLRMKYEDGFVAYLNGQMIAADNAPGGQTLMWNSGALAVRDDSYAADFQDFDVTAYKSALVTGDNVLAIHGLNATLTSSDLLILPELVGLEIESIDISARVEGYFHQPTPGQRNEAAVANLGPIIRNVTENPPPPDADTDLTITAGVVGTTDPVLAVGLSYLVNFDFMMNTAMFDDGLHGDGVAGDNIYGAVIPASAFGPGDMVRWQISAVDNQGHVSDNPLFLLTEGRRQSPQYFGTVIDDPSIDTSLPVFQYFVRNPGAAATRTGTRASVFYLDEFYDNVFIRLRGGYTTQGRKFEFNDGHHFRFDPNVPRVDEININEAGHATNQQSPESTYMRQVLSWETYDNAGAPGSTSFPMHMRRNGRYLDVRIFVEQQDRDFLRREGLDPDGALYKMYNQLTSSTGGVDKKTRLDENNADLQALVSGIRPSNPDRGVYLFDNVNIPAVINYIAVTSLIHDNDHVQKNYYLYRDTEGTGQWMFLPWDKDLTFGRNWGISGIQAAYDPYGHPFFGDDRHRKIDNLWNRLVDAVMDDSTTRSMYLRRLRTLMDELLQPPGTPANQLMFERRIDELEAMLAGDVGDGVFYSEVDRMKAEYLAVRREHLFVNHSANNPGFPDNAGIPDAQADGVEIRFGAVEFDPASGNQDEEYIELINPNPFAVDISGWKLEAGVEHVFEPGTVISTFSSLYVTPNVAAFLSRATDPTGGQRLFVQGNYQGHLSSWGETIDLIDARDILVDTIAYAGDPSDQQRYLRVTELMYHPPDPSQGSPYDAEAFEYIELQNTGTTTLPLNGVTFTDGIYYTFGDVTLAAGEYVVVASNPEAFESRYAVPSGVQVLGPYRGQLSNGGEAIKLADAAGDTILEFSYNDNWYDATDGQGFSLTIKDAANTERDAWDDKDSWQPSPDIGGSPGQ